MVKPVAPAPAILIPGLLSDAHVWCEVQPAFDGDVHVPDLRTAGSIQAMVDRALSCSQASEIVLIGHSMGARVAMEAARQAPQRVKKLVLISTGSHPLAPNERAKRQAITALSREKGIEALAAHWLPGMVWAGNVSRPGLMDGLTAMVCRMDPSIHARQIQALIDRPDARSYLSELQQETLLLVGREDRWSPVSQHSDMANRLPHAQLHIIEEAGHFLPLEQGEKTAQALRQFLSPHG